MLLTFSTAFLAIIIPIILWWWWNYVSVKGRFYRQLPTPPGLPILGNILELQDTSRLLDVIARYKEDYGGFLKVNIGPFRKMVLVADYKLLEFVMSSQKVLNKAVEYEYFHSWLGTGLLTSDGPKWKKRRRIITPAFHFKILEQFVDFFETNGNILMKKLEANQGENTDIYPFITLYTLDVICETAMGVSINAQNNSDSEYVRSVKEMCRIIIERSTTPLGQNNFTYQFTKNCAMEKEALGVLHQFALNVIKQRQEEKLRSNNKDDLDGEDGGGDNHVGIKRKRAFLDLLLDATVDNRPLTVDEIREEVDTFMFEGHDTTASALSFALYSLANHPEVQRRAYREQIEIFGDLSGVVAKYQDLLEMKYLEQIIKEALRLYPSVPLFGRETDQEIEFENYKIPKGVTLVIVPYVLHRDVEFFPNPNKFDPNRFDHTDGKLPFSYIPFSAGPRNCIGQKFAMLEMKSVLSKIIRNFELVPAKPEHKVQLAAETILKPTNGTRIGLKKRQ